MRISLQLLLSLNLALFGANFLLGCTGKGGGAIVGSTGGATSPLAPTSSGGTSTTASGEQAAPEGTSHSGGGTGIDGKVFESYQVDPVKLPAFKLIQPLLKNILDYENKPSEYDLIFKIKTWYIAPIDLEKVSKDLLGVSFLKSETQQIARQTETEVWISKSVFDKMTIEAQSELLLHELVMNIYLFKFMKLSEMCKISKAADPAHADHCGGDDPAIDRYMAPEKAHQLNQEDNENIRYVTGWILQNATRPVTSKEFNAVVFAHGFDPRFFGPNTDTSTTEEKVSLTSQEFFDSVNSAELTGNTLRVCHRLSDDKEVPCQFEIKQLSNMILQVQLSIEGESPIVMNFNTGLELTLYGYKNQQAESSFNWTMGSHPNKVKVGDRIYSGTFTFSKAKDNQPGLILKAFILKPGVIVSVDKKRAQVCEVLVPKVIKTSDDVLIVKPENAPPKNEEIWVAEEQIPANCDGIDTE